jgi:dTDP-4-amino-4,6-dideoxygalactose transaminase
MNCYVFPDLQDKEILRSWRTPANMPAMDAIALLLKLKYIDKIIESNLVLYLDYLEKYKDCWFTFPKLDLKKHKLHIRNFIVLSENREKYIQQWLWRQYYDIDLNSNWIFWDTQVLKNTKKFFKENLWINFYFWKDTQWK